MTKSLKRMIIILCAVLVLAAAVMIILRHASDVRPGDVPAADISDDELHIFAMKISDCIKERDYEELAGYVHPEYGVIFVPYTTVNLSANKCFTAKQVYGFSEDEKKYVWGVYDGVGDPIELTPNEYFDIFVWDKDYTVYTSVSFDGVTQWGNALNNLNEVFVNERTVDYYIEGKTEFDWSSLCLCFEEQDGKLYLSAVVHNQWTI